MGEALLHDVRAAWRHLRRAPGFAIAAIVTLALDLGVNTAVFTVLNALSFRGLAISDPHGLIGVSGRSPQDQLRLTPIPVVGELAGTGALRQVCGYNGGGVLPVDVSGAATQGIFAFVTGQCFATFGVPAYLGRLITDEDAPLMTRGRPVAVIGHRFWTRMFGGDPGAIGRLLRVEGEELTVIGVLPPDFEGLQIRPRHRCLRAVRHHPAATHRLAPRGQPHPGSTAPRRLLRTGHRRADDPVAGAARDRRARHAEPPRTH